MLAGDLPLSQASLAATWSEDSGNSATSAVASHSETATPEPISPSDFDKEAADEDFSLTLQYNYHQDTFAQPTTPAAARFSTGLGWHGQQTVTSVDSSQADDWNAMSSSPSGSYSSSYSSSSSYSATASYSSSSSDSPSASYSSSSSSSPSPTYSATMSETATATSGTPTGTPGGSSNPTSTNTSSSTGNDSSSASSTATDTQPQDPTATPSAVETASSGAGAVFFNTAADFSLPEIAHWPDTPSAHDPELAPLPAKPDDLQVEELPESSPTATSQASAPAAAREAHQNAIADARDQYELKVQEAEEEHDAAMAAAGANYQAAVSAASAAKQAALDGYTPRSLAALEQAVRDAEAALQAEIDRVTRLADSNLWETASELQAERSEADQKSEDEFATAAQAATEASMHRAGEIEQQRTEAAEQLADGEITEAEFDAVSDSVDDALQAESERLAAELSALQETRDNAWVDHAATESVQTAAAQKLASQTIAGAGQAQAATLRQAQENLAIASSANQFGGQHNELDAIARHYREVAEADKVLAQARADADADKAAAIRTAAAARDKALAVASHDLSVATAQAGAESVTDQYAGDDSATAAYRIAEANAARDRQVAQADALLAQKKATIAADRDLDIALIRAAADRHQADAGARSVRDTDIADAAQAFRTAHLGILEEQDADRKTYDTEANARRDKATRQFDRDMAEVQKIRQTRSADELKSNRKARALAQNERDHGLITQSDYESRVASLSQQAEQIRIGIAQGTFGQSGAAADSSGSATESKARSRYVTETAAANNELTDKKRDQQAALKNFIAGQSESRDAELSAAEEKYQNALADARLVSESKVTEALRTWIRQVTTAQSTYQGALADAAAAYAIAMSQATGEFYKSAANDYADAVADHAASDGDNPWSDREAVIAEAEAERIAAVAASYTIFVTTTANASADSIGQAADAQGTLLVDSTIATLDARQTSQQAKRDHDAAITAAEQTQADAASSAVSGFNSIIAGGNDALKETSADAAVHRNAGYFAAALGYVYELIPGYDLIDGARKARQAAEASVGTDYANIVIDAEESYLNSLAAERQTMHEALAAARKTYMDDATDANEALALALAGAIESAATSTATAHEQYGVRVSGVRAAYDRSMLDADYQYTVTTAAADRTYAKAVAAADATLDVAIAQRKQDAVVAWADSQLDSDGQRTPHAQFSVDVGNAELTWQTGAAPVVQTYRETLADEIHELTVSAADAAKTAGDANVTADQTRNVAAASAVANFRQEAASQNGAQSDAFIGANASYGRTMAELDKTFTDTFSDGRRSLENAYAAKSAAFESDLVDDRTELHQENISQFQYDVRRAENRDFLTIALAGADNDFAHARAGATEDRGQDMADAEYANLRERAAAAKARHEGLADGYEAFQNTVAAADAAHTTALAAADAAHAIAVARAGADFDNGAAAAWTTAVSAIGDLDVKHARAEAQAEADRHVAVAQRTRDQLADQYGNAPSELQRFALRVADARVSYLQNVSDDFVTAREDTARHAADADARAATAEQSLQNGLGSAMVAFMTSTENALSTGISSVAAASSQYAADVLGGMTEWVDSTVGGDQTRQLIQAAAYQSADRQYASAEAFAYRERADLELAQIRDEYGQTVEESELASPTAAGGYLDEYNQRMAKLHYTTQLARASSTGVYQRGVADAENAHVESAATASHTATTASTAAQHALDVAVADAYQSYAIAAADAYRTHEKTLAKSQRDRVVADTQSIATAMLAQYTAARDLYQSFDDIVDADVKYAIAQVEGAYAYANALTPEYVGTQTTIADANLEYARTVVDALHTGRINAASAEHAHALDTANDSQSESNTRSSAWKTVVTTAATAHSTSDQAVATANAIYEKEMAALRRDARIDAGWGGDPEIDAEAVSELQQQRGQTTRSARETQDEAVATAKDNYFDALAKISRDAEHDGADRDHTRATALIDSLAQLQIKEANAEFTAKSTEIDAEHDYQIADIDAVIAGLAAVRNHFQSDATILALNQAQSTRDERAGQIDTERAAAHGAADQSRQSRLDEIETEKTDATEQADADQETRRDQADDMYDQATAPGASDGKLLPSIEPYDPVGLGVSASTSFAGGDPLTLVDRTTVALAYDAEHFMVGSGEPGSSARTVRRIANGVYADTGIASITEMGSYAAVASSQYISGTIGQLPAGDDLLDFADVWWGLTRQQAAKNAATVRSWGSWVADGIRDSGNEYSSGANSLVQFATIYTSDVYGRYIEGAVSAVAGVIVDPAGTTEALVDATGAYYEAGGGGLSGAAAAGGMLTGTLGLYESYSGEDFLTGETLSGDERFDRAWSGTSGFMTTVGGSAILKNIAQNGIKSAFKFGATAPVKTSGQVSLPTRARRLLYDNRDFQKEVSKEYWATRGGANDRSLHHWLIPQRARMPQGIQNAGFNLINLPPMRGAFHRSLDLNTWMGWARNWGPRHAARAARVENSIRIGIPALGAGTGYVGYEIGGELWELLNGTESE